MSDVRKPVTSPAAAPIRVPIRTRLNMLARLHAIQGSWNYEILLGNGIGFCVEPALRLLPGGPDGPAAKQAIARQSTYFNAHPYLASIAVGALARAELDGEPPEKIERFRTALCGPLGSVGDRLVWAGWLPFCSLAALALFGLGMSSTVVVLAFLITYNVGHEALRVWGLSSGLRYGLRVADALANPVLRRGPLMIGRLAAFAAGIALPLALVRVIGPGRGLLGVVLVAVPLGAIFLVRTPRMIDGWRVALLVLSLFALVSVSR